MLSSAQKFYVGVNTDRRARQHRIVSKTSVTPVRHTQLVGKSAAESSEVLFPNANKQLFPRPLNKTSELLPAPSSPTGRDAVKDEASKPDQRSHQGGKKAAPRETLKDEPDPWGLQWRRDKEEEHTQHDAMVGARPHLMENLPGRKQETPKDLKRPLNGPWEPPRAMPDVGAATFEDLGEQPGAIDAQVAETRPCKRVESEIRPDHDQELDGAEAHRQHRAARVAANAKQERERRSRLKEYSGYKEAFAALRQAKIELQAAVKDRPVQPEPVKDAFTIALQEKLRQVLTDGQNARRSVRVISGLSQVTNPVHALQRRELQKRAELVLAGNRDSGLAAAFAKWTAAKNKAKPQRSREGKQLSLKIINLKRRAKELQKQTAKLTGLATVISPAWHPEFAVIRTHAVAKRTSLVVDALSDMQSYVDSPVSTSEKARWSLMLLPRGLSSTLFRGRLPNVVVAHGLRPRPLHARIDKWLDEIEDALPIDAGVWVKYGAALMRGDAEGEVPKLCFFGAVRRYRPWAGLRGAFVNRHQKAQNSRAMTIQPRRVYETRTIDSVFSSVQST